ncbi:hypothetical protein [Lonepinella sp. BR2882]|uniref:hypothetical protein n=1 Tax=Lonepinella sp. BR2882 TaxID=3095283 RepID=UPI003F6DE9A1
MKKSRIKHLFAAGLVALTLTACNEDSKDYSGSYVNDSGRTLVFKKVKNNEYIYTFDFGAGQHNRTTIVKENRLYDTDNELLGEFENNSYKNNKGTIYTKQ